MDVKIVKNNAINYYLSMFRNELSNSNECRHSVDIISMFLAGEISNYLTTKNCEVRTPLGVKKCEIISEKVVLVPVLRAGVAMLDSFQRILPVSDVGFIWAHRDKEARAVYDNHKFPSDIRDKTVIILDTMLATAGTVNLAVSIAFDSVPKQILCASILSTEYGIEHLSNKVSAFVTSGVEDSLNEKLYVYPGVGDSGDRLYG